MFTFRLSGLPKGPLPSEPPHWSKEHLIHNSKLVKVGPLIKLLLPSKIPPVSHKWLCNHMNTLVSPVGKWKREIDIIKQNHGEMMSEEKFYFQ